MKKTLSLAISLLFFLFCYSQNKNYKGHIALSIGPSLPVGDFADDNLTDNKAGIAKLGQVVNIAYTLLSEKRFGFATTLQGQSNPLNVKSIEKEFAQIDLSQTVWTGSIPNQPIPSSPIVTYPNWNFQKTSWLSASLLMGGYGEFPVNDPGNIFFTTKVMIGPIYASSPKIKGSSITDTASAFVEQSSSSAFGFTYLLSGGMKFTISKRYCLLTSLEYVATNRITFKDIKTTLLTTKGSPGSPVFTAFQSRGTGQIQQKISALNLLVGIGIKL